MSLIEIHGLSKNFPVESGLFRFRRGTVRALKNVSLSIEEGDALGLVGESGSGKTTLAKILTRVLPAEEGTILWESKPMHEFSRRDWAGRVQMIFQDPAASLNPRLRIKTQLMEGLRARSGNGRADGESADRQLTELLTDVGLPPDALFYYPHQFSGGQKQRLAIARSLAASPRLLIADEPVSALDLSIQAQILNLLMDLKDKRRLTLLVISHDLSVLSALTNRLVVLKEGAIVEEGDTHALLQSPRQAYTRALVDAVPALSR